MKIPALSLVLLACSLNGPLANRTYFLAEEARSLSELPLDELIHIKSILGVEDDAAEEDSREEEASSRSLSLSLPIGAQPLTWDSKKPMRRHGYHYEEKGKDTKISKIFQLSITALSFLAFGGYLLTLIITAIRQNTGNNNGGNGNVILLSGLQSYNRPKRSAPELDPAAREIEIEKLYRGMIFLSKSYAMYNN